MTDAEFDSAIAEPEVASDAKRVNLSAPATKSMLQIRLEQRVARLKTLTRCAYCKAEGGTLLRLGVDADGKRTYRHKHCTKPVSA